MMSKMMRSGGVAMKKKMMAGGGMTKMGAVKTAAPSKDGLAMKGKTKGTMVRMSEGGKMPMVEKDGKKVPAFVADGKGKMNMGGMAGYKMGGKMGRSGGYSR